MDPSETLRLHIAFGPGAMQRIIVEGIVDNAVFNGWIPLKATPGIATPSAGRTGPEADRAVVPLAQCYGPPEQLAEPAGSTADLAAPAPLAKGPWDHLGLEERASNTFYDLFQGTYIGRVHTVGVGGRSGVKALCHMHPHCVCWLNSNVLQATAMEDLVVWLSRAVTEDEQGHYTASQRLKRGHGMRV